MNERNLDKAVNITLIIFKALAVFVYRAFKTIFTVMAVTSIIGAFTDNRRR
jgi:hypothetical protein